MATMTVKVKNRTTKTVFWSSLSGFVRKNPSLILIYGLIIFIGIISGIFSENFRDLHNLINILRQSIVLGLIVIGQGMVVLAGGMDMSVAMIARIVAVIVASVFHLYSKDSLTIPMIIFGVGIGVIIGGFNGLLITRTHANPFIVTFGMASVLQGLSLAISSTPIQGVPPAFLKIYEARIGIVPINVFGILIFWLLAWTFTTRFRSGRALFAVGGSERMAHLSAIRVNRILMMAYTMSGICSALAGLFLLSRFSVGDPTTAQGMDFQSIVAVALGGISLYGGKGSMIGALAGVLLLTMLSNVFNIVQINIFYQQLLLGLIVLIAVAAYKSPRSL